MPTDDSQPAEIPAAPIPRTFLEYLRSFGPGMIVVLTWLGAGDIVEMGVSGGNYGYSLMWVLVLAIVMRFLFVSLIAKYQLCNQHGEGVLDGLVRVHPLFAPGLLTAAVLMGHFYGSYMTIGIGESLKGITGIGEVWLWAVLANGVALLLVFQPAYGRVEVVFKVLLAMLAISFVGTAIWVGPDPAGIVQGLFRAEVPKQAGKYGAGLIAVGMIGAVGGSLMNLVYPYFIEAKGWRGPAYRRVQLYDFLLAMAVMIILDLAVWTLGAELLHPKGIKIETMEDLTRLLADVLGENGARLFYLGIFAAVFTSLVGHALGLACMGSHAWLRCRRREVVKASEFRSHRAYRLIVVWCLVSPLIWTAPGMPGFVELTLLVNAAQVALLPLIAGGLWWITASKKCIGAEYRNSWWENLVMAVLFCLAVYGAIASIKSVVEASW
ncbi:MAG: Nramp family divalent metal transporter [Planctomycetes bacterium]|nr:Nramp family divalent metal transporter [Planctomycetota bacterium]